VNRQIFYAAKLFEAGLRPADVDFPPRRIPVETPDRASGLCRIISEDEVKLPATR
jgi:hypothetical protein